MPSWKGATTSPADAQTFVIPKTTPNPDAAYRMMLAIMTDPTLMAAFGGQPANRSLWKGYLDGLDRSLPRSSP
jgi:spermidine/putrescine-binding protein